ncbi:MAG TPA: TonB family protein [Rhizomicrobium sp.]|jgi:protein TonB
MSTGPAVPLSEFSHHREPAGADNYCRIAAALLTGLLYAAFAVLAWWSLTHVSVPSETTEVTATLLRDVPTKRAVEPLPPFLAHLIRPRAEKPALPVFTIASGTPPQTLAQLPASAAQSSPMQGGTGGNGTMGQATSGNGTGGNGGALAGCLDPIWMRAVTERVRQFFYFPGAALAVHRTGLVIMHFAVRRNGQMDGLKISKSSGDDGLDKAATDIMQKAQPLPPIPDRMHTDQVYGELAINFGMRNFNGSATAGNCGG